MLAEYLPILIFMGVGTVMGVMPMVLGAIVSPKTNNVDKKAAYECGFAAFEDARVPFDVRFYLVAILFILFDLETAFLFPWAVVLRQIGWFGIGAMAVFLGVLVIGFFYEWRKGALEWE